MRMASCSGSFLARLVQFQRTLVGLEFLFCRFPKYKRAEDTDRTKGISLTSHIAITMQFNENVSVVDCRLSCFCWSTICVQWLDIELQIFFLKLGLIPMENLENSTFCKKP